VCDKARLFIKERIVLFIRTGKRAIREEISRPPVGTGLHAGTGGYDLHPVGQSSTPIRFFLRDIVNCDLQFVLFYRQGMIEINGDMLRFHANTAKGLKVAVKDVRQALEKPLRVKSATAWLDEASFDSTPFKLARVQSENLL